jgi:hypothetical protein
VFLDLEGFVQDHLGVLEGVLRPLVRRRCPDVLAHDERYVALRLTALVGTMQAAYLFVLLALITAKEQPSPEGRPLAARGEVLHGRGTPPPRT